MTMIGSSQNRVDYYWNDCHELPPGLNIFVQLDYHHIFKEYISYSKF